jgi:hypothetical protein
MVECQKKTVDPDLDEHDIRKLLEIVDDFDGERLAMVSAGRCARVSYLTHDGKRDLDEDVKLAEKLMASGHWSPFEHVAQALPEGAIPDGYHGFVLSQNKWSGNLRGWTQFRSTVDKHFTWVRT